MRLLTKKKAFLNLLFLFGSLFLAHSAFAQNFITVTATVTDPNGIPYAGGTMNAILVPGPAGGWTLGGPPSSGRIGPIGLDSTGSFTANFGSNAAILPASSQWQITVNSNPGGIQPPLGTGAQSFTVTVTISGPSPQSISSTLNAAAPKLTNFVGAGGGVVGCTTPAGIAYENGTANVLTCDGQLLRNAGNLLVSGPPASSFDAFTGGFMDGPFDGLNSLRGLNASAVKNSVLAILSQDNYSGTNGFTPLNVQLETTNTGAPATDESAGFIETVVNSTGNTANAIAALAVETQTLGSGNIAQLYGYEGELVIDGTAGNITLAAVNVAGLNNQSSGGTTSELTGFLAEPQGLSSGVTTNAIGFHATTMAIGTNNYGFLADAYTGANKFAFFNSSGNSRFNLLSADTYSTVTNCSGVGTAANPSVATCTAAAAGSFSCATAASTGTCRVNTTAVTANSQIFVQEDDSLGTKLGVTCNTNNVLPATAPLLGARVGGTSFTINLGTFSTNPLCFSYFIVN